jgi:hypothetical protein
MNDWRSVCISSSVVKWKKELEGMTGHALVMYNYLYVGRTELHILELGSGRDTVITEKDAKSTSGQFLTLQVPTESKPVAMLAGHNDAASLYMFLLIGMLSL